MTSPLQTDISWDGVVATVAVTGELDITAAGPLRHRLLEVASARPERLVLDLGGLVFVDAAGARALKDTHRLLEARCQVIVHRPPTWSRKIFAHTGRTETGPAPVADDDLSERLKTAHARAAASYERTRELWLQTEGMLADNRVLRREVWESCHDRQPGPARQALLQRSAYARLVARLQTMPVIEQAKGIIMAQSSCGDAEAFDMLRRASLARAVRGSWTADGVAELPLFGKAGFPAVVHRAAGMVSQQCGCEITDALALLRARAFSAGRPAEEIAAGVLRGELRFH